MANIQTYNEIKDMSYFVNCRGADFIPSYQSVWDKSAGIPTMYYPFVGAPSTYNSDVMYFAGTTRTSLWTHFDRNDVQNQIATLKNCGFNLLRVPLDFYCWSALGTKFIQNAQYLASVANDYRMYIQWVLFECDTQDDVSGTDILNRNHAIGGKDPETLPQAISKGLHYWQRCPTVFKSELMTRHPSSLVSVGDSYLTNIIYSLSGYRSTLHWEVMANVYFNSTENPADISGYNFLTSAVNKVKSLKPSSQKVTASYKHLITDPNSPYYSLNLLKTLSSLDFVCYRASHISEVDRNITYANALSSMVYSKKPILAIDIGSPSHFNFLRNELDDFYKFRLGWITDGIIDHNFSVKPNNNSKGVAYSDGMIRSTPDVFAIVDKMCKYLNIVGKKKQNIFDLIPQEKTNYETTSLQGLSYSYNDHTRLSQWGDVGGDIWSKLKTYITTIPDYKYISSKFAPFDSNTTSKSSGWEIADTNLQLTKSNFAKFFYIIIYDIALLTFSPNAVIGWPGITDEILRDKFAFKRIHTLERLQKSLPITLSSNTYRTSYDPSFIFSGTQQSLLDSYKYFKPITQGGLESIPYIGTPRYFSSLNTYNSNFSSLYAEPLENCQKPIGFFNNKTASGSCFYSTGSTVNTNKKVIQNVISKIDWSAYDNILKAWLAAIISAYEELFQMKSTTEFGALESIIRTSVLGLPLTYRENTRYQIFSRDILNIKSQIEEILASNQL